MYLLGNIPGNISVTFRHISDLRFWIFLVSLLSCFAPFAKMRTHSDSQDRLNG